MHSHSPNADIRTLRMCRQVEEALALALAGCSDDLLQALRVVSVTPGPQSSMLAAVIEVPTGEDPVQALARLEAARGLLRTEIAASISRKKVPQLLFRLAPAVTKSE